MCDIKERRMYLTGNLVEVLDGGMLEIRRRIKTRIKKIAMLEIVALNDSDIYDELFYCNFHASPIDDIIYMDEFILDLKKRKVVALLKLEEAFVAEENLIRTSIINIPCYYL